VTGIADGFEFSNRGWVWLTTPLPLCSCPVVPALSGSAKIS
jgi:hypothetical protein